MNKKRKRPPVREMNRERAARVLVEATLTSNAKAAHAHGTTVTTIAMWRKKLETDPELAGMYAAELRRADGLWRNELRLLMLEGTRRTRELLATAKAEDLPIILETIRIAGELLVQWEALVFDGLDAGNREGRAPPADAPGAGEGTPAVH
jgi:hypothetical protein